MSEENKIDQPIPSQPVEDVFSSVEEINDVPTIPTSQEPARASQEPVQENIDISEASIGQEELASPVQKEVSSEPRISNDAKEKGGSINTNKILFYLILSLIILLGAFAIWALVF